MMMNLFRGTIVAVLLLAWLPVRGIAQSPHELSFNEPLPQLLLKADSAEQLRTDLEAYAREAAAENAHEASRALAFKGRSHERAGQIEQALDAYRRALAYFPKHEHRLAIIDLLLKRRSNGDVARAIQLIEAGTSRRGSHSGGLHIKYEARRAWSKTLIGQADSASIFFAPLQRWLLDDPTWRYRIGRSLAYANQERTAFEILLPLAVQSRGTDSEVIDLMNFIGDRTGIIRVLDQEVRRKIGEGMRESLKPVRELGAFNLRFFGRDSFPLGGVIAKPRTAGPHRAAVIMVGPEETVQDYDSLTVLLRDAGFAVMLMDVRGSGESVAAACPLPDTWTGREDRLQRLTARDVRAAFERLAKEASIETSRYLLVANRGITPIAVQAAQADDRITALVLVSPRPEEVERGAMRAGLEALALPVYFQVGPEDYIIKPVIEEFYQVSNRGASWVSDGRMAGSGPGQFRFDPRVAKQFRRWVNDALPLTSGQNEARPSKQPKG